MNLRQSHACLSLALLIASSVPCSADILVVNAEGTGQYPTIQAAVDAAVDGDEVHLTAGAYQGDGNFEIRYHGKAITVRSETGDPADVSIAAHDPDEWGKPAFIFDGGEGASSILSGIRTAAEFKPEGGGGDLLRWLVSGDHELRLRRRAGDSGLFH